MQQLSGRVGEAVVFSVHERVDQEFGRRHMSSWVDTAVQAFPSRVGAGLIDLFLQLPTSPLRKLGHGNWWRARPRSLTRRW
jgi:hypothetical protein